MWSNVNWKCLFSSWINKHILCYNSWLLKVLLLHRWEGVEQQQTQPFHLQRPHANSIPSTYSHNISGFISCISFQIKFHQLHCYFLRRGTYCRKKMLSFHYLLGWKSDGSSVRKSVFRDLFADVYCCKIQVACVNAEEPERKEWEGGRGPTWQWILFTFKVVWHWCTQQLMKQLHRA